MIRLIWNNNTVALDSPDFGDTLGLKLDVIIKRSMNKTPYSFINPSASRILEYSWSGLSRRQVRNLFEFMKQSKGRDVTVINHENERWYGAITTNPITSSHDGINNSKVSLTFEGVQVA